MLAIHNALTPNGGVFDPSVQSVSNKKGYTKKALELTSAVKWGGLAFAALLTIASILLIGNTIRLSLYARRRDVEVMKLVGATDWFIRWPFVIEGVIVGARRWRARDRRPRCDEGRAAQPAVLGLVAGLADQDDRVPGADRGDARREHGRLGARFRALAAAIPEGLSPAVAGGREPG